MKRAAKETPSSSSFYAVINLRVAVMKGCMLFEKKTTSTQTLSQTRKILGLGDDTRGLNAAPNVNTFNGVGK